jgi:hypothetical protein
MADIETVRTIMTQAVPFNRVLGLQFVAVEDERTEVVMPQAPERLNHVGTIHAAAQRGWARRRRGDGNGRVRQPAGARAISCLAASAQIAYRRSPPRATCAPWRRSPSPSRWSGLRGSGSQRKARFSACAVNRCAGRCHHREITVEWALLKPRAS